jgi:hypothetical protein
MNVAAIHAGESVVVDANGFVYNSGLDPNAKRFLAPCSRTVGR